MGLEALVLVQLVGYPYWPNDVVIARDAEVALFIVLSPLAPLLLVLVAYERPIMRLAAVAAKSSAGFRQGFSYFTGFLLPVFARIRSFNLEKSARAIRLLGYPRVLLAFGAIGCGLMASLAYWPFWNTSGSLSGVDSGLYEQWFSHMRGLPLNEAIRYAFSQAEFGSRALFLVPFHLIGQLVGADPRQIVISLPFVLGPFLALATFRFVRSAGTGDHVAGLAALFTALSFNITAGIWGAYYANWLALAEAYLFLSVLLSFQRQISFSKYTSLTILSLLILLTHPWTWVLILTVSLFFSISDGRKGRRVSLAVYVIPIIIVGVGTDLLKNAFFGPPTIAQDLATKASIAGLHQLFAFWPNIVDSLVYTHGGIMANSAILALAAAGLLGLKWKEPFQRLLITWVFIASVPLAFFGSYHQSRILYDMPTATLSATGLILLVSGKEEKLKASSLVLLSLLFTASWVVWSLFVS